MFKEAILVVAASAGMLDAAAAQPTGDQGLQKLLERGRSIRNMTVCSDLKRADESGPRDAKDLAFVQDGAMANEPACLILLGRWSERGQGVPKDAAQARTLYERAAPLDPMGHAALGRMAEQGVGAPVSYAQAWDQYSQAAANNDAGSLVALGRMAEHGLGRAPSEREAVDYYRRAARRWNEQGWLELDRIQSARAVMTDSEAKLEQSRWRSLLGTRVADVGERTGATSSFKDFPYEVILRFAFRRGEHAPLWVRVASPSKDPAFDQALQQAAASVRMPPAPVFSKDTSYEVELPMRFKQDKDEPGDAGKKTR
ncbi:hypothetical protein HH212_19890 [Massilia forsythiae]|uniref:Sel1 repeat family protein n=1 Tax=Massilia forsythiae TaxID=2728020 RepID=A0A7Z2VZB0_9BURK|nr:SEL1-like repeat protein [Massilia forsythiae]QJE01999.1 hypothetical protein HH212_19890 [Massilia forsythiae]